MRPWMSNINGLSVLAAFKALKKGSFGNENGKWGMTGSMRSSYRDWPVQPTINLI